MSGTTAPTGVALDLRDAGAGRDIGAWASKRTLLADLAALRAVGLNRDRDIEAHPARTSVAAGWVVGRPDHHAGLTYLMSRTGDWIAGRLTDAAPCYCPPQCRDRRRHPAAWAALRRRAARPPTVTHDYTYSSGRIGLSDGRGRPLMSQPGFHGGRPVELTAWCAFAWCLACRWATHDHDEHTVRAAARHHRAHPAQYAHHQTPRRTPR